MRTIESIVFFLGRYGQGLTASEVACTSAARTVPILLARAISAPVFPSLVTADCADSSGPVYRRSMRTLTTKYGDAMLAAAVARGDVAAVSFRVGRAPAREPAALAALGFAASLLVRRRRLPARSCCSPGLVVIELDNTVIQVALPRPGSSSSAYVDRAVLGGEVGARLDVRRSRSDRRRRDSPGGDRARAAGRFRRRRVLRRLLRSADRRGPPLPLPESSGSEFLRRRMPRAANLAGGAHRSNREPGAPRGSPASCTMSSRTR